MTSLREFETTSIHLAAALLIQVPGARLSRITPEPSIDGKRLIVIEYPTDQTHTTQQVVEEFHNRRLTVSLYLFNRTLNLLRDRLCKQQFDVRARPMMTDENKNRPSSVCSSS